MSCVYRYYAAFPSLSDKCDLLAGVVSSSSVEPAWSRVAQKHPKVADDTKIVAVDSGISLARNNSTDSGLSFRDSCTSGSLPGNGRRHRKPRKVDDGRRRKQGQRRVWPGWRSGECNLWPSIGFPFLCSSYDSHWSLAPSCVGFSPSSAMFYSDWSLAESYKDKFSDLAESQWSRPSYDKEMINPIEGPVHLEHAGNQEQTDIDQAQKESSSHCENTSEFSTVSAASHVSPSLKQIDGEGKGGGSIVEDSNPLVSESVESLSLVTVRNEQSVVADQLPQRQTARFSQ